MTPNYKEKTNFLPKNLIDKIEKINNHHYIRAKEVNRYLGKMEKSLREGYYLDGKI